MRTVAVLLPVALLALALLAAQPGPGGTHNSAACAMVQEALSDYQRIKPGIRRKEVERYFEHDGGLQFPDKGRYTYPRCDYIKLEVEFDPAPSRGSAFSSPNDTVRRVSKLFIDYPTKD